MYYCNTLKITFQNTKVNVKSVLKSVDERSLSALTVVASPRGRVSSLSQVFSAGWEFREEGGASPPHAGGALSAVLVQACLRAALTGVVRS